MMFLNLDVKLYSEVTLISLEVLWEGVAEQNSILLQAEQLCLYRR